MLKSDIPIDERTILQLCLTGQTFILNIVIVVLDLMERCGHVLREVTALGSPGGHLQFDSLGPALVTTFH
jgi:hypothetical protein